MNSWFECKVSYEAQDGEKGMVKAPHVYLIDALSFTEAETRAIKEATPMVSLGGVEMVNIRRVRLADVFLNENEVDTRFYRIKVMMITIDEKTAKEKKTAVHYLVQSEDLQTAVADLVKQLEDSISDYQIAAVTETAIEAVFNAELS